MPKPTVSDILRAALAALVLACSSPAPMPDAGVDADQSAACFEWCDEHLTCFAAPAPIPCRQDCNASPAATLDAAPCPDL